VTKTNTNVPSPYQREIQREIQRRLKAKKEQVKFNTINTNYEANIVQQYTKSQNNRVKFASLIEMMQNLSDDEASMSNKKVVLPQIRN